MDNITMTDKQLDQLVDKLAGAMIKRIYGIEKEQARKDMTYFADREEDNAVGELARLMTLMNIYEDREEYEKCAQVKKYLDIVNKIVDDIG
jgi:hypothetical protein